MSKKIKRLIKKIDECNKTTKLYKNAKITLIIGNSSYPQNDNLSAKGLKFYDEYNVSQVAFLTARKNLNLVSIIGILLGSIEDAIELIESINGRVEKFAIFLHQHHIYLVNIENNESSLSNLIKDKKDKCKVLFVGTCSKSFAYKINFNKLIIPHPSCQTYATKEKECYETYFEHSYPGEKGSNLTLKDFKIKY